MTQVEISGPEARFARHGGRLDDAARAFPGAPGPWIDLSTGINPLPWHPPAGLQVDTAPLPTAAALAALEAAAAATFGVDPRFVAAVPGSEIALRLLPTLGLPRPLRSAVPSYGTHRVVADALVDRRTIAPGPGTLLIANPNNPDGALLTRSALHELLDAQAAAGGWLVVDEAFVDVLPDASVLAGWDGTAPLVITRSFGKFFGLAGIRLGFVVAPEAVTVRMRALLGDWPVSGQAIAWGRAAYADLEWTEDARRAVAARAARLDALLAAHGLLARGACPLFRLVDHAEANAIFHALARAGILTRPFDDRPDWLRFGLPGDEAAFDRLDRALANG